jgi:hypothetical protein
MVLPAQIDPQAKYNADSPELSVVTQIRPISMINGSNRLQFVIPRSTDMAIDLSATRLGVVFSVTKEDSTIPTIPAGKHVGTINDQLSSLFPYLNISINSEQVVSCTNNHILSFLMRQFNHSAEYRRSILYSVGYEEAAAGEEGDPAGASFQALAARIEKGKKNHVVGHLTHPFFSSSPKLFPPNTEVSITLTLANADLFLISSIEDKLKINIHDCYLMMRMIKLETNIVSALQESLNKNAYIYPYKNTSLKIYQLAKGESSFTAHNVHYGNIPSRIILCMIPTSAFLGTLSSSPFKFVHNKLIDHKIYYNSVALPLTKINYEMATEATELFEYVVNEMQLNTGPVTPGLTYSKFISDGFFIAQNLINNTSVSSNTTPYSAGNLSIELSFKTNLTDNTSLVVLSEFGKSYISIDKFGSVKTYEY